MMNCPHCQTLNPDQAKFCMNCGERLPQVSSPVSMGEARSEEFKLDRYLPPELVTKLEFARARQLHGGGATGHYHAVLVQKLTHT